MRVLGSGVEVVGDTCGLGFGVGLRDDLFCSGVPGLWRLWDLGVSPNTQPLTPRLVDGGARAARFQDFGCGQSSKVWGLMGLGLRM